MKVEMFVQVPVNVVTFEPFWNLNFKSVLIIYIIHVSDEFRPGAFDLDDQGQIGLQHFNSFEQKLNHFSLHLQTWSVNWSSTGFQQGGGGLEAGGDTCFFVNAKKALTSLFYF